MIRLYIDDISDDNVEDIADNKIDSFNLNDEFQGKLLKRKSSFNGC